MDLNLNLDDFLEDIRMEDLPPEDDIIDSLAGHEYLMFPEDEVAQEKCNKLRKMAVGGHIANDWTFLDEIAETDRAREIIGFDTPWARLFEAAADPSFRELTVEFLPSFCIAEQRREITCYCLVLQNIITKRCQNHLIYHQNKQ
ncbi:hypothetical protein QVD17_38507 [Tagetes erecta]|uniref:Uncharacterized protein n=1 Tax=Tagetes erecta TaxID=13708 RepID=A0AAD8JNB3_TARER|nr:hypothetical protein QVD17_38507 [Tagetes erecta]